MLFTSSVLLWQVLADAYLVLGFERLGDESFQTLRPQRSVLVTMNGHQLTAEPTITPDARQILDQLPPLNLAGH